MLALSDALGLILELGDTLELILALSDGLMLALRLALGEILELILALSDGLILWLILADREGLMLGLKLGLMLGLKLALIDGDTEAEILADAELCPVSVNTTETLPSAEIGYQRAVNFMTPAVMSAVDTVPSTSFTATYSPILAIPTPPMSGVVVLQTSPASIAVAVVWAMIAAVLPANPTSSLPPPAETRSVVQWATTLIKTAPVTSKSVNGVCVPSRSPIALAVPPAKVTSCSTLKAHPARLTGCPFASVGNVDMSINKNAY